MRLSDFFDISKNKNGTEKNRPVSGDSASAERLNRQIKALTPGQTIHGEIVSRNGNEVQIRLSKDMVLTARLDQAMNLELGKGMTFEVKNNGSSLTLSPLFANTATDANVLKALTQASLPVNGTTVEMTQLMMEAGMSIGKDSLNQMFRDAALFPEAQIRDIVDLRSMGLPVNEENLNQMASYRNLTHQLVTGMNNILDELPQLIQNMLQSGDTGQAAGLYTELLRLAGEAVLAAGGEGALTNAADEASAGQENMSNGAASAADGSDTDAAGFPKNAGEADGGAKLYREGEVPAGDGANVRSFPDDAGNGALRAGIMTAAEGQAGVEDTLTASSRETDRNLQQPLRELLNALDLPPQEKQRYAAQLTLLQNGELGAGETMQLAGELLRHAGAQAGHRFADTGALEQAIKGLLLDKELGGLVKGALQDSWTLQPGQLKEEGRLTELYNRLDRQLRSLSQALEHAGQSQSGAMQNTAAMSQNLDFLQQLNQMYTYVQLPLKMNGSAAHGELYVYTNKKHLASKDGSVSALLHLDMEHLGPLDVYVAMQSGKVSTQFYVQDEEMLDFLGLHMDLLTARLQEQGYDVKCGMQVRENGEAGRKQPALRDLLESGAPAVPMGQYSFDVRA